MECDAIVKNRNVTPLIKTISITEVLLKRV